MLYAVGSRIDLTSLNPPREREDETPPLSEHVEFESGTKIRFVTMTKELIIMNIIEPPMVVQIGR